MSLEATPISLCSSGKNPTTSRTKITLSSDSESSGTMTRPWRERKTKKEISNSDASPSRHDFHAMTRPASPVGLGAAFYVPAAPNDSGLTVGGLWSVAAPRVRQPLQRLGAAKTPRRPREAPAQPPVLGGVFGKSCAVARKRGLELLDVAGLGS